MPNNGAFSLSSEVLLRLDVQRAVEEELAYTPPYLPPGVLAPAISERVEEVAQLFHGQFRRAIDLEPAESLQVIKRTRGLRPVSVLGFQARVLYRALIAVLAPSLPAMDRSFERRQEADRAPLELEGVEYVVISDVADFYHYIDHRLLVDEVIAQTGEAVAAEALGSFLHVIMDREFGIPQVFYPSDVLSEAYIDVAERRLLRQRLATWRTIDDFRIAALTWREAGLGLEALDSAIRAIGLSLNEHKTRILGRETYDRWLNEPEQRWNAFAQDEVDLRLIGDYGEPGDIEIDNEAVWEATAARALEALVEEGGEPDRLQEAVNRQVAGVALGALEFLHSTAGVAYCKDVLLQEPQLTSQTATYLREVVRLPDEDGDLPVLSLIESLIQDPGSYLSPWQILWLTEPIRQSEVITDTIAQWLSQFLRNAYPDVLRARVGLTLAEKGRVSEESLAELYNMTRVASRPDLVAGIARVAPDGSPILASLVREGPLNRWLVDSLRG